MVSSASYQIHAHVTFWLSHGLPTSEINELLQSYIDAKLSKEQALELMSQLSDMLDEKSKQVLAGESEVQP
jgi:DNA-binding transcriptional MerR regulator